MSEFATVARPYAKAAFDFAVEHQSLERWQQMLLLMSEVTCHQQIADQLLGSVAPETLAQMLISVCGDWLDEPGQNFIRVMAQNGRLQVLPEVLTQFNQLRALLDLTIDVDVLCASPLNDRQQANIAAAMEKRLSRKVKLNCKIDKSVLAGIVIRAGDMVIDGSVRGRLARLADVLQS